MVKKSVEKSGNIVINTKAVRISNNANKRKANKTSNITRQRALNNRELQIALIDNFVALQKVLTNLTARFEMMTDNLNKLLQLFEVSAKSFIQKQAGANPTDEQELLKKLDTMLDQNKTVAKGITLIEEKIRHRIYGDLPKGESQMSSTDIGEKPKPRPLPRI